MQTHYVVVNIVSLYLNMKVLKHFKSDLKKCPSVFSLETTITVIYLTLTDHENNKPTCLFLLSHNVINTVGFSKKIAFLCFPKNLTTEYQSNLQCFLLLHSLYTMFTETPEKSLMHARMCCSVKF